MSENDNIKNGTDVNNQIVIKFPSKSEIVGV